MDTKGLVIKSCAAALFGLFSLQLSAATTGLDFAGGCPESGQGTTSLCSGTGDTNADVNNVAAILGVDVSLVTYIGSSEPGVPGSGFTITGFDTQAGDWSISDTSITHLAFKSDGYFILGERKAGVLNGTWDNVINDIDDWDLTLVDCPATICDPGPRAYTVADFQNFGGNFADLSNVRAFSVVPVPAAVWLFGSGLLGLIGIARRKRS